MICDSYIAKICIISLEETPGTVSTFLSLRLVHYVATADSGKVYGYVHILIRDIFSPVDVWGLQSGV